MYKARDGSMVYEKKDFEFIAEVMQNIKNPLEPRCEKAQRMCENIANAMLSDDGIVVSKYRALTCEHGV